MKEKFDISKFNSRLATLIIILASLGIAAIVLDNVQWLATNYYGFYEFTSIFAGLALFVLPFLFVGWVFSWIVGRRKKDVDHIRLPIRKGVATIILFIAFFLALNFQSGKGTTDIVLDIEDVHMYSQNGNYYVAFYGPGVVAEDEYISLKIPEAQYNKISDYKETVLIQYTYNTKLSTAYHFELAKSEETENL